MASMDGALAEALAGAEGEQDVEKKIEQALACPCLGDLKEGPCGATFVHAFTCFIRSEHGDKGMDCLDQFREFQLCLQHNPQHVAKIMEGAMEESDSGISGTSSSSLPSAEPSSQLAQSAGSTAQGDTPGPAAAASTASQTVSS